MKPSTFCFVVGLFSVACCVPVCWAEPKQGIVVLSVEKSSGARVAGIQPGDVLQTWRRISGPKGKLGSNFDLFNIEIDQVPAGPVRIKGMRDGRARTWELSSGEPGSVGARPVLSQELLRQFEEAEREEKGGHPDRAGLLLLKMADSITGADTSLQKVWFHYYAAKVFASGHLWAESDRSYKSSLEAAGPDHTRIRTHILMSWSNSWRSRNNWTEAERLLRLALADEEKMGPESLVIGKIQFEIGMLLQTHGDLVAAKKNFELAHAINLKLAPMSSLTANTYEWLGNVSSMRGDQETAIKYYRQSLGIRQKIHANGVEIAFSLANLGIAALRSDDLASAEDYLKRSYGIQKELDPDSLSYALIMANIGTVLRNRGDLAGAEEYFLGSKNLRERLEPNGPGLGYPLMNLGVVAMHRGDLDQAENNLRKALDIYERLQPGSLNHAACLVNLGNVLAARGDLDGAEPLYLQALEIKRKRAPGSDSEATALISLGTVPFQRGDFARAEGYYRSALDITQKIAPDGMKQANVLFNLAAVARRQGKLDDAMSNLKRSLAIRERNAPGSLFLAETLSNIAVIEEERADLDKAEGHFRQALAIAQKLAPDSASEAELLNSVGGVLKKRGDLPAAREFFCRATTVLESQTARLGGGEDIRAGFRANFINFYQDCLESLIATDRTEESFAVLERSRARSLLNLLAERDLNFAADAPADLLRQRKLNAADYDRAQGQISNLNPAKDGAQIETLLAKMRELSVERQRIAAKIREASPRLAALQFPQPLDLAGVRKILDPGTVLLAYAVGESETILFTVRPAGSEPSFTVHHLNTGDKDLRQRVQAFRNLIERQSGNVDKTAAELYDLLVRPADAAIGASERILIIPDGPLHSLPFSALRRDAQFLVEWKPLHTSVSASIYGELKKPLAPRTQPAKLAAFGDPQYPQGDGDGSEVRSVRKRGFGLDPLPASRDEVRMIGDLYPEPVRRIYLGAEATEERVKALGRGVRYIHFATHGLLDAQFPLNSALVLSIPKEGSGAQDNGLLQAWEIFEQLRIDADLVTLSACETGLGQEVGGEGLIGLTRAFQYAGARSILATLWSVADSSTADLMQRFYQHLESGQSKDEALRAAQMEEIRNPRNSHPFYWAAFSLSGDWASPK